MTRLCEQAVRGRLTQNNTPFGYCGEYLDSETGTIYLRARYYSPANGRFTTEDSIRDGLNWYAYCSNNPVYFIDPSGLIDEGDPYYDKNQCYDVITVYNQDNFVVYASVNYNYEIIGYSYLGDIGEGTDKNYTREQVKNYIIYQAISLGIPIQLALSVGLHETYNLKDSSGHQGFVQWNADGSIAGGATGGGGYGIMQIQKSVHPEFNDKDYENNWQINVDCGLVILKTAYTNAIKYTAGDNLDSESLARSAYCLYNGGEYNKANVYRWTNSKSPWAKNDIGFKLRYDIIRHYYPDI